MSTRSALSDITTINALLTGAKNVAITCGQSVTGAEHLVISALALPDGTARRAFERAGADPDQFRQTVSSLRVAAACSLGHGTAASAAPPTSAAPASAAPASAAPASAAPPSGVVTENASAQRAFQVAVQLSKATKPCQLRGAHVILAICTMEHGTSAQALSSMGIDRATLRAAAEDELGATS